MLGRGRERIKTGKGRRKGKWEEDGERGEGRRGKGREREGLRPRKYENRSDATARNISYMHSDARC